MATTLTQIIIHLVFHVKPQQTDIRECDLTRLFEYTAGTINNMGCKTLQVGGMPDHLHILFVMTKNISIADFVRDLKSSTSKWLRTIDMHFYNAFYWQAGYGAFSVSPSFVDRLKNYFKNQAEHHKSRSTFEEFRMILDGYGVKYNEEYIFDKA